MPELPEVEAHAERLSARFTGHTLERFVPLTFTALKTAAPSPEDAVGRPLDGVGRRGKFLLLGFGDRTFVVHLMQGGRLVPDDKQSARPRNGIARWVFDDGPALLLTEAGKERKAGVWVLAGDPLGQDPLATLGIDAADVSRAQLGELLGGTNMRLHGFLRDQHRLSGLGRMLANEICHRAKVSPFAMTGKLGRDGAAAVHQAIHDCVADGLAYERTRRDMSSSADRPGAVHGRVGQACPACGDTIRSVSYSGYTVAYCPTCQTGGKVLADNTTSKFLK
jgi:formamidopyrimidine-DNA glycosylase